MYGYFRCSLLLAFSLHFSSSSAFLFTHPSRLSCAPPLRYICMLLPRIVLTWRKTKDDQISRSPETHETSAIYCLDQLILFQYDKLALVFHMSSLFTRYIAYLHCPAPTCVTDRFMCVTVTSTLTGTIWIVAKLHRTHEVCTSCVLCSFATIWIVAKLHRTHEVHTSPRSENGFLFANGSAQTMF